MIDKKVIDEAAKQYSSFLDDKDKRTAMEIGFKAGVDYVMDKWHEPSENPNNGVFELRHIVIEWYENVAGLKDRKRYAVITNDFVFWNGILKEYSIVTRWAYLEDFMKGGNHE